MDSQILTMVRKELRSYFLSPVAIIFLAIFLFATMFIFFTLAKFFGRNLADVRPLFNWLPILLIFLVSALTMRQWSEEQKLGTLEILLTLPLRTSNLVLGKFLAGMCLVALALAFTLPLPFTVAQLGDLDWGPVVGGYVAALLLASTYMAIGLCVSSRTDNQIVALMVTLVIGGLLYLAGSDSVVSFFSGSTAEILRSLGTGSRFSSIERGVLDVRDFFYYGSLTTFFLTLNIYFLELKRMDAQPSGIVTKRPVLLTTVLLTALNVVAGNLWLAPITTARADLTAGSDYTISDTTRTLIDNLDEPLVITGYFSDKTHPMLGPIVPRIRDFLKEYEITGSGNVKLSFINPSSDEELQKELNEQYKIESVPFRIKGRNEESVVNSYFHVLIKYGDQFQVLSFAQLVEVHADEMEVSVRLRNIEYDISSAIRKVTQGFTSMESLLSTNDQSVKITGFISPDTLPPDFADVPRRVEKIVKELNLQTGGRISYELVNPTSKTDLADEIMTKHGFRPLAVDLYSAKQFWCYLLVESAGKSYPIFPQGEPTEGYLRTILEAGVRRMTPGYLKTIGLVTKSEEQKQQMVPGMQSKPPRTDYRTLETVLKEEFEVRRIRLDEGVVPGNIDVLVIGKLGPMTEKIRFAIDQYLMRGGAVIALAGMYGVKPQYGALNAEREDDSLFDLLQTYGVEVEQAFVMDTQNSPFPIPVRERRGSVYMNRLELVPYPFFPDLRQDGLNSEHFASKGIQSMSMNWSSPVWLKVAKNEANQVLLDERGLPVIESEKGVEAEYIAWSSKKSWVKRDTVLEPDFRTHPGKGFGPPKGALMSRIPMAVTLKGTLRSYFAERPSPLFEGADDEEAEMGDRTGRTIKSSTPEARLVVIGSSDFTADLVAQLGSQLGGGAFRGNLLFVRNLVDWALADTDLLSIRSAGAFARTLRPMKMDERARYELINYVIVILSLLAVLGITITRRKMTKPIPLNSTQGERV